MALPPFLTTVIGWLRAGYPEGVPEHDYLPLFSLLSSQLSDDEIAEIAEELAGTSGDQTSAQAVRDAIASVTHTRANDADVARVSAHLAAGGWPLANPAGLRNSL